MSSQSTTKLEDAEDVEYDDVRSFLVSEARCLDDKRFDDWLDMLTESVEYRVPQRVTKEEKADSEFLDAHHFKDDRFRLEKRIRRRENDYAWSHNPPIQSRHFVSNIEICERDGDDLTVKSNLMVACSVESDESPSMLTGERTDVLTVIDGELKLDERLVELDQTALPAPGSILI